MAIQKRKYDDGAIVSKASLGHVIGATSGGSLAKTATGEFAASLNSTIPVNDESAFSTPSDNADGNGSGHREDEAFFSLGAQITLSSPIIPSQDSDDGELLINGNNYRRISYSGTGALLRSNPTSNPFATSVTNTKLTGDEENTLFAYSGGSLVLLNSVVLENFADLGEVAVTEVFEFTRSSILDNKDGLKLRNIDFVSFTSSDVSDFGLAPEVPSKNQIELENINFASFYGNRFTPRLGDYALHIPVGSTGSYGISNTKFDLSEGGGAFNPAGLDQTDPRVTVSNCPGVPDSKVRCDQVVDILEAGAPETVILEENQPVVINNVYEYGEQERIVGSSDGGMMYVGLETHTSLMIGSVTIVQTTGGLNINWAILPAVENATSMLVSSIADAGGGNINIVFNNPHNLVAGNRIGLFGMSDAGYDYVYTIDTVVNDTTVQVIQTFTSTATGAWRLLVPLQRKTFELDTGAPQSVAYIWNIRNLKTGNKIRMLAEQLSVGSGNVALFNKKAILT